MFKIFYAILMTFLILSDVASNKRINKWELIIWKIIGAMGVLVNG